MKASNFLICLLIVRLLEIEVIQNTLEVLHIPSYILPFFLLLPTDKAKKKKSCSIPPLLKNISVCIHIRTHTRTRTYIYIYTRRDVRNTLKKNLKRFVSGTITLQKSSQYILVDHQRIHIRFSPTFFF